MRVFHSHGDKRYKRVYVLVLYVIDPAFVEEELVHQSMVIKERQFQRRLGTGYHYGLVPLPRRIGWRGCFDWNNLKPWESRAKSLHCALGIRAISRIRLSLVTLMHSERLGFAARGILCLVSSMAVTANAKTLSRWFETGYWDDGGCRIGRRVYKRGRVVGAKHFREVIIHVSVRFDG
jgi:hypothetical protein